MHLPYKIPKAVVSPALPTAPRERPVTTERTFDMKVRPTAPDRRVSKRLPSPPDVLGLYPYQVEGVTWLRETERALFADEMGLGKTIQVVRAFERRDRGIVTCPASLRLNWLAELNKWRPDLDARVCLKSGDMLPSSNEIVILSYETLPEPVGKSMLLHANLRDTVIVPDEAHYLKNHRADRTKAGAALIRQAERSWLLTGTPLLGRPLDLFGLLKTGMLLEKSFGGWDKFIDTFGGKRNRWGGYVFKNPNLAAAREALQRVMLRRKRADVLPDLPQKVYTHIPVEIGISRVIDRADTEWQLYGATELPPFEMMSAALAELASAKIPAMFEQIDRFAEEEIPLLVFSAHRAPIDAIRGRKGWGVITGDTPTKERHALVQKFQAEKLSGLALTIQAGGVGLTLTSASHELFVDRDYTPAMNSQAEDRAVRIGQKASSVQVLVLVADHPLDRRLQQILESKQKLIAGVVG